MTFLRIMFVKEHPYLYRQTNVRYGDQVKSYCTPRRKLKKRSRNACKLSSRK